MPRAPNPAALVIAGLAALLATGVSQAGQGTRPTPPPASAVATPQEFSDEVRAMARRADFNADGRLDQEDVRRLFNARATNCATTLTDVNGDGACDHQDVVDLISLIASGVKPGPASASAADAQEQIRPARLMAMVEQN
jgi:hypothetical protein